MKRIIPVLAGGLVPLSRYSVSAETDTFEYSLTFVPGGVPIENFWILPWTYQHITLDLGTFKTDSNGLGGVKGTIKLEAGRLYDSTVTVFDNIGTKVLEPDLEGGIPDTSGFMVY